MGYYSALRGPGLLSSKLLLCHVVFDMGTLQRDGVHWYHLL